MPSDGTGAGSAPSSAQGEQPPTDATLEVQGATKAPEDAGVREQLDVVRAELISYAIRRTVNDGLVVEIEKSAKILLAARKRVKSYRAQDLYDLANDQVRNAMNHIGLAYAATDLDETKRQISMAIWHLNVARMQVLMPAIRSTEENLRDIRLYVSINIFKREPIDEDTLHAIRNAKLRRLQLFNTAWQLSVHGAPTQETLVLTAKTVSEQRALVDRNLDAIASLRTQYDTPNIVTIRRHLMMVKAVTSGSVLIFALWRIIDHYFFGAVESVIRFLSGFSPF